MRGRLSGLGARVRGQAGPEVTDITPTALGPTAPIAALAERLDIGASAFVAGPRHACDIDVVELPALLVSVAHHAAARDLDAYIQLPGRCLLLTVELAAQRLDDIGGRPRLRLLLTHDERCQENIAIELWKQASRAYRSLSDDSSTRLSVAGATPPRRGPARTENSFDEPIDVVYTWVDSNDPGWRAMASEHLDLDALEQDLYTSSDELRYSLRSVETFAPWVNHVFVLSNCGPPSWFRPTDRVTWVDHREVAKPELLPLFNSGAIDTFLHHIPGLSEHFLYLNDDFLLWDGVTPATFFTDDGRSIARLAMSSSVIYLQQLVENGTATPSQHSRVNAARLLEDRFGVFQTRVHGHVPYAMRRSAMETLERDFAAEMAETRASRTRQPGDTAFIAYLYHHVGQARGEVLYAEAPASFVTLQNYRRAPLQRALRSAPFVCFQDSRGSATDADYQSFKRKTLEAALPLPSSAEVTAGAGAPGAGAPGA